ncbi:DUF3465 domain-containing protein [Marinobacterium aestuariivivens]|uniref:DUF3465 domain-containing protein n=1 Tax=Marinobacterium aestuariivivens TaxID=1698799 RepID=A0ABW2A0X3_9GAMM
MKKLLLLLILAAGFYGFVEKGGLPLQGPAARAETANDLLAEAFRNRQSNLQVQGEGRVLRLLPDDRDGSRHQRFILELGSGQTLLIAHNIDLAPRIDGLREGDRVEFFGEYEWNEKGGVVHWTHRDPRGRHPHGWLRHDGRTYR